MYRYEPRCVKSRTSNLKTKFPLRRRGISPACIDPLETRAYLTGTLGPIVEYPGVTAPTSIVVGDFNNDGKPDIAVAGTDPNTGLPTVAIYLNTNGLFPSTPIYNDLPAAKSVFSLATTNVAEGANTDLVVTDPVDAQVWALLGNGDGTFATPVATTYGTPQSAGSSPTAYVVSGPFGPNLPILIVTDPADHQIVTLNSNGDGTYAAGTPITSTDPTFSPEHIVAADFNQDGHYDIAFNDGVNPQVFEANGDGNGGFSAATPTDVAGPVQDLTVANLTTDGSPDIVATTSTGGTTGVVNVLLNTGGTFAAAGQLSTTFANPGPVIAADIDGDGVPDIITMNAAGDLDFFHGSGSGSFLAAVQSQPTSGTPTAITTADVNGDIKSDVLFAETNTALTGDGGIGVLLGQTPPDYTAASSGAVPTTGVSGQKIKISQSVRITNITSGKVKGTATIELALSPDPTFGPSSIPLVSVRRPGPSSAGKATTVRVSATKLPAGITPGTYYLLAEVTDPAGGTATSVASTMISVAAPQIDLSGSVKKLAATARIGRSLPVTIVVNNTGNVPATGVLPVAVYSSVDGTLDGTSTGLVGLDYRINIKPGKSTTLHLNKIVGPSPAGNYYIVIVLDPNNTLGDVNTANNTFASTTQVSVT